MDYWGPTRIAEVRIIYNQIAEFRKKYRIAEINKTITYIYYLSRVAEKTIEPCVLKYYRYR